jgi:para-nitrobenzyl esterase
MGTSERKMNVNPTDTLTTAQKGAADSVQPSADGELAGTAWRLVQIMSMDDRVYVPDDRSLYWLEFTVDGSARVRADCGFGKGTWASESAGHLVFGPIAANNAVCPPGSLHDRYMAQFPWVRSYVLKDGRLFLATMADGSIIEFEPMNAQ